jgi:histidine ammonia-lyase
LIELDGHHLTLYEVARVARRGEHVKLSDRGLEQIIESRQRLEEIMATGEPVYGINTGFGIFADQRIPSEESAALSRNLILSHAVGTGLALDKEIVRAAMLVRANTLTKGFSGVRVEIVQTLLDMLNRDVTPVVPSQGSLGSSGDLCPLSHLALVFTTDERDLDEESGEAYYQATIMSGKAAMKMAGLERIRLGAKEGLALNNGATFSAAIGALAVVDASCLLEVANLALGITLEAVLGCLNAFDVRLHEARGHLGQIEVARQVLRFTEGSTLVNAADRVQDAYSLRCSPQVLGAARDALRFASQVIEIEINAATDNPLIFGNAEAISGGNFHGEPVGMAMDFLSIAMAEAAAISERRVFRLTDGKLNAGLPPMLVDRPEAAGVNSGLMMPQYTAASLVLENQTLASPDSVRSLPTSAEQEDHNANSMTAARHTRQIIANTLHVLAIELYTASRAIDLRLRDMPNARLGRITGAAYRKLRSIVPYQPGDAWWGPEIQAVSKMIVRGDFSDCMPTDKHAG